MTVSSIRRTRTSGRRLEENASRCSRRTTPRLGRRCGPERLAGNEECSVQPAARNAYAFGRHDRNRRRSRVEVPWYSIPLSPSDIRDLRLIRSRALWCVSWFSCRRQRGDRTTRKSIQEGDLDQIHLTEKNTQVNTGMSLQFVSNTHNSLSAFVKSGHLVFDISAFCDELEMVGQFEGVPITRTRRSASWTTMVTGMAGASPTSPPRSFKGGTAVDGRGIGGRALDG